MCSVFAMTETKIGGMNFSFNSSNYLQQAQ